MEEELTSCTFRIHEKAYNISKYKNPKTLRIYLRIFLLLILIVLSIIQLVFLSTLSKKIAYENANHENTHAENNVQEPAESTCSNAKGFGGKSKIQSVFDGNVLDVHSGTSKGAMVHVWGWNGESENQKWGWNSDFLTTAGSKLIPSDQDGDELMVLDEHEANATVSVEVDLGNAEHQLWLGKQLSSGIWQIKNKKSGNCLANMGNNLHILGQDCSDTEPRQKWNLLPA